MRSILIVVTFLAIAGLTFSLPDDEDNVLLEDMFRVSSQEGEEDKADIEALKALVNSFSSIQDKEEDGGETAEAQGLISKLGQVFRVLRKAGIFLHRNFPHVKLVRKYSKYLRCFPHFQEEMELVTSQSDEEQLEALLNSLETQAQSDEEISEVQFFRKFFKKAKKFGGKIWKKAKKLGAKVVKIIKGIKNYLKCIKKSKYESKEEMKQVEQQAMHVLQNAITAHVIQI